MKVAVIGIGRVGLPFAVVAARYHSVVGIDINKKWIEEIKRNEPLTEPHLNEYLEKYPFEKTTDFSQVSETDLIFIIVGSQEEEYSSRIVMDVIKTIRPYLTRKEQVLVVISTLKPGSMDSKIMPFLNKHEILGKIKGVCYNPVFVALGKAIKDFQDPHYVIIGESNPYAGDKLSGFYKAVAPNAKVYRNNFQNIEVFKFALNLVLINKISLLNTLTEYCEKYGANIDFIAEALKEDPRIAGRKMFKGGLGFGGTCFPVDARSFKQSQKEGNLDLSFLEGIINVNERQIERTVSLINSINKKKVSVLGITYKPDVGLTVESQALEIARRLSKTKDVMIYDPQGMPSAKKELGRTVKYAESLKEALRFGKIILIAVEWPIFSNICWEDLRPSQIIVDPWRLLKKKKLPCTYIGYGLG